MVKRYGFDQAYTHPPLLFYAKPDGCYVTQTDYAKLEAERDRLKQSNADLQHDMDRLIAERDALREMVHNLLYVIDAVDALTAAHFDDIKAARTALGVSNG